MHAYNKDTLVSNKQYSPSTHTFDLMSDAEIKAQMDLWVQMAKHYLRHYVS